jgi:integrase
MALLQECPQCKTKLSLKYQVEVKEGEVVKKVSKVREDCPSCGCKLQKAPGKAYWIEYYINGRRKRERIGPNKGAAEQRLREVLKLRAEERWVDKDKSARLTLGELARWYLSLKEVQSKDSYRRDKQLVAHLLQLLGENSKLNAINPGKIESYQHKRLSEPSQCHPGESTRPATVNRDLSCLKTMFNRAVRNKLIDHNPISGVKKLAENNVRMRILTTEEFFRLLDACPSHIRPVVMVAYYMGMRKNEIIYLVWNEVDLQKGFIRLSAERTKTNMARAIPIHPAVRAMLERLPRGLHTDRVFLKDGQPFNEFKRSFTTACRNAGIQGFVFHDLRHCALNNLRRSGNDYFEIMALSGHKTMSCFKRYNLVTEDELARIKWPEEGRITGTMDTPVDTKEKEATALRP